MTITFVNGNILFTIILSIIVTTEVQSFKQLKAKVILRNTGGHTTLPWTRSVAQPRSNLQSLQIHESQDTIKLPERKAVRFYKYISKRKYSNPLLFLKRSVVALWAQTIVRFFKFLTTLFTRKLDKSVNIQNNTPTPSQETFFANQLNSKSTIDDSDTITMQEDVKVAEDEEEDEEEVGEKTSATVTDIEQALTTVDYTQQNSINLEMARKMVEQRLEEIAKARKMASLVASVAPATIIAEEAQEVLTSSSGLSTTIQRMETADSLLEEAVSGNQPETLKTATTANAVDRVEDDLRTTEDNSSELTVASSITFESIKAKGLSGTIAYVITELGFWTMYPLIIYIYQQVVPPANELAAVPSQNDMSTTVDFMNIADWGNSFNVVGLSLIFVTIARFAVPLRIAFAFTLIPWVENNIMNLFTNSNHSDDGVV